MLLRKLSLVLRAASIRMYLENFKSTVTSHNGFVFWQSNDPGKRTLACPPKAADLETHLDSWHIEGGPGLCTVHRE